jgi:hypothetical protein
VHEKATQDIDTPILRYEIENFANVVPRCEAGEKIAGTFNAIWYVLDMQELIEKVAEECALKCVICEFWGAR